MESEREGYQSRETTPLTVVEYPTRESGDMAGCSDTTPTVSPTKAKPGGEQWRVVAETYERGRVLRDYPSYSGRVPYSREWGHGRVVRHRSHGLSCKGKRQGRVVAETYEMGRVLRDYPSNGDTLPYPREEGNGRVVRHRSHGLSCKGKSRWRAKGEGSGC